MAFLITVVLVTYQVIVLLQAVSGTIRKERIMVEEGGDPLPTSSYVFLIINQGAIAGFLFLWGVVLSFILVMVTNVILAVILFTLAVTILSIVSATILSTIVQTIAVIIVRRKQIAHTKKVIAEKERE